MGKTKALSKTELSNIGKNLTAIQESDVLPSALMKELEDKLPAYIKEYEADGTSIQRWNFEFALIMEYLLQRDFGFTDEEVDKLNRRFKELLPVIYKMKMEIPTLLTKEMFGPAEQMVERNKMLYKAEKAGITLPTPQVQKKIK